MKYKVLYFTDNCLGTCLKKLEKEVNELCACGWKPQGGISTTEVRIGAMTSSYTVSQAMVKEDNYPSM